jgi:hypothetical protein
VSDMGLETTGPIDYLVVEFPAGREPDGSALNELVKLADAGIVKVYDLAFFRKDLDGSVAGIDIAQSGLQGVADVTLFAEASSGLLGESDLVEAAEALEPGCSGALLVYENAWAAPFAVALRKTGAQLVSSGRIPIQAILATLDALDADAATD